MTAVKERAYAKINLYLDVTRKREDGFHDIKTVMHSVSLHDDIVVTVTPSKTLCIDLVIEGNKYLPTDEKNLAYRAAVLFYERLGIAASVKIKLIKCIPVSAGLAGGSSDAAAVLRALNKLNKRPFTTKALCSIGAELGSDIPYCIVGKTVLCEGRGERMTPVSTDISLNVVIASAGERVSTPDAYKALDLKYSDFDGSVSQNGESFYKRLSDELSHNEIPSGGMYNIFESVVFESCKRSAELKATLLDIGAVSAMMSGSGPSVYALFKSYSDAELAKIHLLSKGYNAWVAHTV